MSVSTNEVAVGAQGGTELQVALLKRWVDPDLLDQVNIIPSRVRSLHPDKPNILWLHDRWDDPEVRRLDDPSYRALFSAFVFVSAWQRATYLQGHDMPYDGTAIMRNAIEPIERHVKNVDGQIRLIYHTTPHRGLELLVPVFERIYDDMGDKVHLDVYSSFLAYGWKERDQQYEPLYERCRVHPGITYHGFQPNSVVREALLKAHIFAYPCIWEETSCIAAIEAMSAGCHIVCPDFGALPETTAGFGYSYPYLSDPQMHMLQFESFLRRAISGMKEFSSQHIRKMSANHANIMHNWQIRGQQWNGLLRGVLNYHETKKVRH